MAAALLAVLPADSQQPPKQLEPSVRQDKENEKEKESRGELLAASSLFNAASSETSQEQQAAENALRQAMSTPTKVGSPDRGVTDYTSRACLPDFTKCPSGWAQRGVFCRANDSYSGRCAAEVDMSNMNVEQKLAFANFCEVAFPCQGECAQDFRHTCPSLWREVSAGICSAPLQYEGNCAMQLNTDGMSEDDKYTWSVRCGARWPCGARKQHVYEDICPIGWSLQFGKVCTAPSDYQGPCEPTAYLSGATVADKKSFEATCHAEWREMGNDCIHDFTAPCPFGWFGESLCIAPSTYNVCGKSQAFSMMTPAAKEDWASTCKVKFPCRDRETCEKAYSAPCPAHWYAFNAGLSCAAPSQYDGPCVPVLHGLLDLSVAEKTSLEGKCKFDWPCLGEVYPPIIQASAGDSSSPRRSFDPAQYASANGPIGDSSGSIKAQRFQ